MILRCGTLGACLAFILFWSEPIQAQYYILGRGLDDHEQPYAHAVAELRGDDYYTHQITTELGVFRFENLKSGSYELVLVTPYGIRRKKIELRGSIDITLHIPRNVQMDEISVVASKAGAREPVTHTNFSATQIRQKDMALDMPYLLEGTPSLVATSDAGHGIGYTGLRIRGTDPTRINVTLNGVPVNDAESHNVFWVDLPDIASSTTNIQIQRGLGWSQPGVGDLGGGIHVNTLGFQYEPYGSLTLGGGSFQSRRVSLAGGTGLMQGRFTLDGRASYIQSDGFIDRAKSNLYSVYGAAGYHHDQTNIRLIYALGDELTYQAWNGVPAQYIDDPVLRTYNSAGTEKPGVPHDNEVDDYRQSHVQLHLDQTLTPFARWNTALHYTRGLGFFEQYKADQALESYGIENIPEPTDLIRQLWLDNHFYGFTSTLRIGTPESRYFILGGAWNTYKGRHFGEVVWVDERVPIDGLAPYYDNDATKRDHNVFVRSNMEISPHFQLTLDLQGRWIRYAFVGPDRNGMSTDQTVHHRFFNPKFGLRYVLSEASSLYGLTGLIHKEPNRDDHINSTPLSRPQAERLWDTEIGFRMHRPKVSLELVGYAMIYKDQLVPTGRLNDVGAYTRVNVGRSYRAGVEAIMTLLPVRQLRVEIQSTLSQNRILAFDEYIDNWDTGVQDVVSHQNTDIAFSPNLLTNLSGEYTFISNAKHELALNLAGRYIGKQYVDNTSREASALDAYTVADTGLRWTWYGGWGKEWQLGIMVRNLFDRVYESNGWIYRFNSAGYDPVPDDPYAGRESGDTYHLKGYFPQAGRHVMATLRITL